MKIFKNICTGIGLTVISISALMLILFTCYYTIVKIYNNYTAISEGITTTFIICGVVWLLCKITDSNFKNFLG